jgi:hypothetical protein
LIDPLPKGLEGLPVRVAPYLLNTSIPPLFHSVLTGIHISFAGFSAPFDLAETLAPQAFLRKMLW